MLKEEIKKYQEQGFILFYNTEGNPDAFKDFVRHLSFATVLKKGIIKNGYFIPNEEIFIVNYEEGKIEKITKEIKLNPLKFLEELD